MCCQFSLFSLSYKPINLGRHYLESFTSMIQQNRKAVLHFLKFWTFLKCLLSLQLSTRTGTLRSSFTFSRGAVKIFMQRGFARLGDTSRSYLLKEYHCIPVHIPLPCLVKGSRIFYIFNASISSMSHLFP